MKPLGMRVEFAAPGEAHDRLVAAVQIADELGVESVWVPEGWGRDAFTLLAELALKTKRIRLGTGIVNVFSRSPAVLAMTAAHLDELSGGRVVLGLGVSSTNVIEQWHGVPFRKPLTRLREYVEIINQIVSGKPLVYQGELFSFHRGFRFRDFVPVRSHIPVCLGAVTPKSIRLAGEIADGWMPVWWPLGRLQDGIELMGGNAQPPNDGRRVLVLPWVSVYVAKQKADDDFLLVAKEPIAFYIGRMGSFFREMLQRVGFEEDVAKVTAAWKDHDRGQAVASVSDRMLNEISIVGSLEQCAERLNEWQQRGADVPILTLANVDEPREVEHILGAMLR